MTKDGIARAAQALAPRVAKSFFKQTEYIHLTLNVDELVKSLKFDFCSL